MSMSEDQTPEPEQQPDTFTFKLYSQRELEEEAELLDRTPTELLIQALSRRYSAGILMYQTFPKGEVEDRGYLYWGGAATVVGLITLNRLALLRELESYAQDHEGENEA